MVGTSEMVYTPSLGLKWALILQSAYFTSFILCEKNFTEKKPCRGQNPP